MVARFSYQKDQKTLIKAMTLLEDDSQLLLVGDGPLLEEAKKLAEELKVSEKIHFLGTRQDVPQLLKASDLMVLSSESEGFGLVAIEGMAASLPVIISDVEGLNTVVEDEDLKFDLGDYQSLSQIIKHLLEDEQFYKEKVAYSLKRCEQFDIDQYVKALISEYQSLLR